jgi:hypothetical protein
MTNAPTPPAQDPVRVLLFHAPHEAAVTLDTDFRYVAVTTAAAAVGTTPEAILGRRCWEVFPEWEPTPIASLIRVVMHTRVAGNIRHPVHNQPDRDIVARVMPTPDGGVRFVFRLVTRGQMRPMAVPESMTGTR